MNSLEGADPRLPIPYVAALIDTQAALSTRYLKASDSTLPVVSLHGSNVPLLRSLAVMTGVGTSEIRRSYTKALCAEHCDEPHVHIESVSGRWSIVGAKATIVLHTVLPHVYFRQEEVRDLIRVGLEAPLKPATATKMVDLGWSVPQWPARMRAVRRAG